MSDPLGQPSIPLFKLRSTRTVADHQVEIWEGYGPVVPTLWTTNGSAGYVAHLTAGHVAAGNYTVEDARIDADFMDAASIMEAIKRVMGVA